MKIVAFVDTLGFKQKISSITHQEAKEVIISFNSEIYQLWEELKYHLDNSIHGQTFSDSLIIYSDDNSDESLKKILIFLKKIFEISIIKCDLPLRGGISVGDFDRIPASNFNNLQKDLVIGSAFVDAYFLESANKIKGSKLVFRHDIKLTIEKHLKNLFYSKEIIKMENGEQLYELVWGDIEFLTHNNYESLNKFIDLACKSKWLDHYYHTLETFLTRESQANKHQIFNRILLTLKESYKYTDTDNFIENFLKTDGLKNLKKSFLAFLRERIEK